MIPLRMSILLIASVACVFSSRAHGAEQPASHTFEARGVKIHYLLQGTGEPVVLIHGLHASADVNWRWPGIMAALAKDHQVIALDLPGHGRSDRPEKEEAYGVRMAEDVGLLLDHLKIKKAHLVGYSLGGMVAVKFITQHPERVISGTLGGMGWLKDGGPQQKLWERMPVREGSATPGVCVTSIARLAVTEAELKAIKVPMTVIVGDRDPVKRLYVAPLQSVRKDWPVVEIEGAGHLNCIFKKSFADEIVKWVGKNSQK